MPSFIRTRSFSACDVYFVNPIRETHYTTTPAFSQGKMPNEILVDYRLTRLTNTCTSNKVGVVVYHFALSKASRQSCPGTQAWLAKTLGNRESQLEST